MKRLLIALSCVGFLATLTAVAAPATAAPAACPAVQVVFARGTVETAPPVGSTGQSFVAALRTFLPGRSVAVYGVQYPASGNFSDHVAFAKGVGQGVRSAQNKIKAVAARCPRTKIVVGGYSQGAAVAGLTVAPKIELPKKYARYDNLVPPPLPASIIKRVNAVIYFAPISTRYLRDIGAPPITVNPTLRPRTARYCLPGDNICNGARAALPGLVHVLYPLTGQTAAGARYAADHVR